MIFRKQKPKAVVKFVNIWELIYRLPNPPQTYQELEKTYNQRIVEAMKGAM